MLNNKILPLSLDTVLTKVDLVSLGENTVFSGLSTDSRLIKPGFIFVAIPGNQNHGSQFLKQAIENGAQALLGDPETCTDARSRYPNLTILSPPKTKPLRQSLAQLAALFWPLKPDFLGAVTGTNGKSSIVNFAKQLWSLLGQKTASLGTLGIHVQPALTTKLSYPALTTLDPISLHHCLNKLAINQVRFVSMETSSHGLEQFRCDGLTFQAGIFTNLSHDHLDYHKNIENYFQAKCRLFHHLLDNDAKVLLNDSLSAQAYDIYNGPNLWFYGTQGPDLKILHIHTYPLKQEVTFSLWGEVMKTTLFLSGTFQVTNVLAAIGLVVASGFDWREVLPLLPKLHGICGRAEKIATTPTGGHIYVDYAHTPDALEVLLNGFRPHTHKKLNIVFGCGGNRDQAKRPIMGQIAQQYCDVVIITDDNPREEDPAQIRHDIRKGAPHATEIADRYEAIAYGIHHLEEGDILLIAGKGHEEYQIYQSGKRFFSDTECIKSILQSQ